MWNPPEKSFTKIKQSRSSNEWSLNINSIYTVPSRLWLNQTILNVSQNHCSSILVSRDHFWSFKVQTFSRLRHALIGHVRYINIPTWLRGFQVKSLYLVLIPLYLSLFWKLRDKGNLKNLQFWPESLGAMLEYWYIERGLLVYAVSQIRFPIGGKDVMCRGSKPIHCLGKQQHELSTRMWSGHAPWNHGKFMSWPVDSRQFLRNLF